MFVKIVFLGLGVSSESMIQCDSIHYSQRVDNEGIIDLQLLRNQQQLSEWAIFKKDHQVYFMNDEGKTIECWRWSDQSRADQSR